jgi:hypothetical protein
MILTFFILVCECMLMVGCVNERKNEARDKLFYCIFFDELLFLLISKCEFACSKNLT